LMLLALLAFFSLSPPEISSKMLSYFERAQVEQGRVYAQARYLSFAAAQALTILVLAAAVVFLFHRGWVLAAGANPYVQVAAYVFEGGRGMDLDLGIAGIVDVETTGFAAGTDEVVSATGRRPHRFRR